MVRLLFFIFSLQLTFLPLIAQNVSTRSDTSWFVAGDDDFNLLMAAGKGEMDLVNFLLTRGADPNAATVDNITSLMYASENGDLEMIGLLLENGADPNLKPYNGLTALHTAVSLNYPVISEYLINHGSKINLKDHNGITPLHYAVAYNYPELTDLLLYYNANPLIADNKGNIPLLTAAGNNSKESLLKLLDAGVDINSTDREGYTALMVSVSAGNDSITQLLLERGADIHPANNGGMTALAFAVKEGNAELVRQFISMNANVNHKIRGSQNLFDYSQSMKQKQIASLLLEAGAKRNISPYFGKIGIMTDIHANSRDFQNSMNFSLIDIKYNFSIQTGFGFRPASVRILTQTKNDTSFQFWERRYFFHAGLEKTFTLLRSSGNYNFGIYAKTDMRYSFGNYRGSEQKAVSWFLPSPGAGLFVDGKSFMLKTAYEYLNTGTRDFSPHYFTMSLGWKINLKKKSLTDKNIFWLNDQ